MKGFLLYLLMLCTMFSTIPQGTIPVSQDSSDLALIEYNKEKIDEDSTINTIKELSSEKYEGRLVGTEQNQLAADYIADTFKQIGLVSPKGTENYKQYFSYDAAYFKEAPILSLEDSSNKEIKNFKNGYDFTTLFISSKTNNFNTSAEKYIISNDADIVTEKVKDKAILISAEAYKKTIFFKVLKNGYAAEAAFIIIERDVESEGSMYNSLPVVGIRAATFTGGRSIPMLYVNNKTFKELSDESSSSTIRFKYDAIVEKGKKVCNVAGVIEGTDEELKQECIIIASHFDHVGSNYDGTYNPGALDNASGTAAMMELARAMKANNIQPKKSILFIAFNGEENGGGGSMYYVNNPMYSLDKSVMIDLDMVGSAVVSKLLIDGSQDLCQDMLKYAQKLNIDAEIKGVGGSDYDVFTEAGYKAILLINEDFKNGYHTSKDTPDCISKSNIEQIMNLVLYYIEKTHDKKMDTMYTPDKKPTGNSGSNNPVLTEIKEYASVRGGFPNSPVISGIDLSDKGKLISTLWFNEKTVWPEASKMPTDVKPQDLLKAGMNPGLGIRGIHESGLTGKGVNIGIIDQPIITEHPEYAGKIAKYQDMGCEEAGGSMTGTIVTSLSVGTQTGTAPEAKVYYAAVPSWLGDAEYYAKALDWIMEENKNLPNESKIKVVCVSSIPSGEGAYCDKNQEMWDKSLAEAQKEGILVLDLSVEHGIVSSCYYDKDDPENVSKCTSGIPGISQKADANKYILAPSSQRTAAEAYKLDDYDYQYIGRGGPSYSISYCAGVLALGWQERPELTSKEMIGLLFESAYVKDGYKIVYPQEFIKKVKEYKAN